MSNNKYYTPTIEEFHVGFEYEFKHPDYSEWEKFSTPEFNFESENCVLSYDEEPYRTECLRVKYLDKDDIISLGYVQTKFNGVLNFNKDSIGICWMEDCPSCITITDTNLNGNVPTKILFNGTIRNKSELKVLLKQLVIDG